MSAASRSPHAMMIRKLDSIFPLSEDEKRVLEALPIEVTELRADHDIVSIGNRPTQSCVVLEGFTCVYKLSAQGKRQIMAVHLPGDIPDLQSLHLDVMDNSVATLCPCTVAFIQHHDLRQVCERYPRIGVGFWRETLVD